MEGKDPSEWVVSDRFWLEYAGDLIKSFHSQSSKYANILREFIGWLLTIYLATIAALSLSVAAVDFGRSLVLVLPAVFLAVAYGVSIWASRPVFFEFDPRVPAEIQAAYEAAIAANKKRLPVLVGVVSAAMFTVLLAIVWGATWEAPNDGDLRVSVAQSDSNLSSVIQVDVSLAGQEEVFVQLLDDEANTIGSASLTLMDGGATEYFAIESADQLSRVNMTWTAHDDSWLVSTDNFGQ